MFEKLCKPQVDLGTLVLRISLAAIFIVHGYIKVIQTAPLMPEMSLALQQLVGWVELLGGAMLLIGLLSRAAALALIVTQIGAILTVTGDYAFRGTPIEARGANYMIVGPEFNTTLIGIGLAVLLLGSGAFSLDALIFKGRCRREAASNPQ